MQPTSAAWDALLAAFRAGVGTEALFAVVIPSRALALTSRLWPPGVLDPAYVLYPYLAPTGQGLGQLSLELADDRSSRRGTVSCQVATQAGQLGAVPGALLTQLLSIGEQPAQVLGAFVGGVSHDQVDLRTLFTGRVTALRLTRGTLAFTLVDGIETDHRDIEIPVGATAFPGSPLDAHGQSIPLIIGTALGLQPLLVGADARGTLATSLPAAAVPTIDLVETAAAFPNNGGLLIESEILSYDGRRIGLLPDGSSTLQLLAPTRAAPVAHAAGTVVGLRPPIYSRYLVGLGLGTLELLAVRDQDGPVATFVFQTDVPDLPPGTGVLDMPGLREGVNVDVQVIPDPPLPPLINGGFEDAILDPWVVLPGTLPVIIQHEGGLEGHSKLQLLQLRSTPTGIYQDVAVTVGERYTVLVYWRTPAQTQTIDDDGGGGTNDNTVDNGDFTDPTDAGWEIETDGMAEIVPEYVPGRIDPAPPDDPGHPTVINGAQTFQLPFAPFVEGVPDPVHPEILHLQAAGYRAFNCLMSQDITVTPGQTVFVDVRVRAWNKAAGFVPGTLPGVVGIPGGAGGSALNVQGTLPPLCEVQVEVTMSTEFGTGLGAYHHFLRPDPPRDAVGHLTEWRCEGGATRFTPSASAYRFGINIFGRYIGAVPPIEVTSAVVVPAPTTALARAEVTPLAEEDEPALQASGLIQLGTPSDPTLYTTRLVRGPTTWQALPLSFIATEPTLRLSLLGQSTVAGAKVEYDGVRFLPPGRNPVRVMAQVFARFLPHLTLSPTSVETAATRRDGWLFSGYVPDPGRTDALLTKMSQECFCTLYKDVAGVYQLVADDYDMPVALRLDSDRDVHQGSTGLAWGNPQEVSTDFYLWYQRVSTQVTTNQAGQYALVMYVTPEASISLNPDLQTLCAQAQASLGTRRRFDYYADFIADPVTADLLLTRLVQQRTLLAQALTVEASLAAVPLEVTDRVSVQAALVGPQPFVGEVRQTTLATSLQAPGLAVGLTVRQVGGARGVWETWDSWSVEGALETPGGVRIPGTTGPPGTLRVREAWEEEGPGPEPPDPPDGPWYLVGDNGPPLLVMYGLLGVGAEQLDMAMGGRYTDPISSQTGPPALIFRNSNVASGVPDEGVHIDGGGLGSALGLFGGLAHVAIQPATPPLVSQLWRLDPSSSGPGTGTMVTTIPTNRRVICMQEFAGLGDGNWLYLGCGLGVVYRWNGLVMEEVPVFAGSAGNDLRSFFVMTDNITHVPALYAVMDGNVGLSAQAVLCKLVQGELYPLFESARNLDGVFTASASRQDYGWVAVGNGAETTIAMHRLQSTAGVLVDLTTYIFSELSNQRPGALGVYSSRLYLGRVSTTATPMLELWRGTPDGTTWSLEVDFAPYLAGDATPDTNTGITALALARTKFYAATGTLVAGPAPGARWYCSPVPEGIV